jgi:2-polyprenyl-3-methyl-5-hydroxy-6-metoxy-1,4-benzoquinol methylase
MENTINKTRKYAQITGYSLVLMALLAGYVFGYAIPELYDFTNLNLSQSKVGSQLYNFMMLGIIMIMLLDFVVSISLYKYFKNENNKLALWAGFLRIVYSLIFCIAIFYLFQNRYELNTAVFIKKYDSFQRYWSIGLIVFGFHLLIVGILMKGHKAIPKFLWYLMLLVGPTYVIIHLLKTLFPHLTDLIDLLNSIFGLPMALAELGLAVWLIVKGGKVIAIRNPNTIDKSEEFWNRVAKRTTNPSQKPNDKTLKILQSLKKYLQPNDHVLDFACGSGILSTEISKHVNTIHGIDISSQMIEVANNRKIETKLNNVTFSRATLFDENIQIASFDVITAFNILHYLEDKEIFMNRINELLKPSGIFISSTVYAKQKKTILFYFFTLLNKLNVMPKINFYSSKALENNIMKGNFTMLESFDISPMPERFIVVRKN